MGKAVIFIRTDGANITGIGMGHLYRMMSLAEFLYEKKGISPLFIITGYAETKEKLDKAKFKYLELHKSEDEVSQLLKLTEEPKKDVLIVDMLGQEDSFVKSLSEKFIVVSLAFKRLKYTF